jgi:hypothetical protein
MERVHGGGHLGSGQENKLEGANRVRKVGELKGAHRQEVKEVREAGEGPDGGATKNQRWWCSGACVEKKKGRVAAVLG